MKAPPPTIHLNGTSAKDLYQSKVQVLRALEVLQKRLRESWPNGRDYYPQGDTAIRFAMKAHEAKMKVVGELQSVVEKELEELMDRMPTDVDL